MVLLNYSCARCRVYGAGSGHDAAASRRSVSSKPSPERTALTASKLCHAQLAGLQRSSGVVSVALWPIVAQVVQRPMRMTIGVRTSCEGCCCLKKAMAGVGKRALIVTRITAHCVTLLKIQCNEQIWDETRARLVHSSHTPLTLSRSQALTLRRLSLISVAPAHPSA